MSSESDRDNVREFLAESDKLIKSSEKSLKRMDAMRRELGLKAGASGELLKRVPEHEQPHKQAKKELGKLLKDSDTGVTADREKPKKKNRSKLVKAMNKKLRI